MTYERLEEGGAEFGDERLEGIGSKYDDLRNIVQAFCEKNGVDIEELQETYDAVADRSEPQYFVSPGQEGYVSLAHLEHSSGRTEWRTTIFDSDRVQSTTIGDKRSSPNSHAWRLMKFECSIPFPPRYHSPRDS